MPYFVGFHYNDDYPAKRNKIDLWNKKMNLSGARKYCSIRHWKKNTSMEDLQNQQCWTPLVAVERKNLHEQL